MGVVVMGISAALVAAVLHGIMVRWLPRRLRVISLGFFFLASVAFGWLCLPLLGMETTPQKLLLGLILGGSLLVDYAIVFTGIEADSPTLSIVNEILDRGAEGLPTGAIGEFAGRRPFVQSRLDALVGSGVLAGEESLSATRGGIGLLVRIAETYRRLCGYQETTG